jgi:hypothetical protein
MFFLLALAAASALAQDCGKPNIVFVLMDNLGYGEASMAAAFCGECRPAEVPCLHGTQPHPVS